MSRSPDNAGAAPPILPAGFVLADIDSLPPPRQFTRETIKAWIAQDAADFARLWSDEG